MSYIEQDLKLGVLRQHSRKANKVELTRMLL